MHHSCLKINSYMCVFSAQDSEGIADLLFWLAHLEPQLGGIWLRHPTNEGQGIRANVVYGDVNALHRTLDDSHLTSSRIVSKQCSGKSHVDDLDWSVDKIFKQKKKSGTSLIDAPVSSPQQTPDQCRHVIAAEGENRNQRRASPCR